MRLLPKAARTGWLGLTSARSVSGTETRMAELCTLCQRERLKLQSRDSCDFVRCGSSHVQSLQTHHPEIALTLPRLLKPETGAWLRQDVAAAPEAQVGSREEGQGSVTPTSRLADVQNSERKQHPNGTKPCDQGCRSLLA